jgi:phosphoglycerate-specific signal transduction histidine kinase
MKLQGIKMELTTVSDVKKLSEQLNSSHKVYLDNVTKAQALLVKSLGMGSDMLKGYDKLQEYNFEVDKSIKDLGLNPSDFPDLQLAKDIYKMQYNTISNLQNSIKNFIK